METRKKKLIAALKIEKTTFEHCGHDTFEHEITIKYLETGETKYNQEDYDLLDAVITDFDCVCRDYGV